MKKGCIGLSIQEATPAQTADAIVRADELGVPAYWLTNAGAGPDALTTFAVAAGRTRNIKLGTSIVPTFPRHPLVMAGQAQVLASVAPGRLVLGIGPSHGPVITSAFGLPFERPLEHLREYVTIVKALLGEGKVDFDGQRFHVHAQGPQPAPGSVPVMISALQANSYRLAGEIADGAIAWISPAPYLRDVALPALRAGAASANRPVPPLVAHAFIALTSDHAELERVAKPRMRNYPRLPFYVSMFKAAGYPEAEQGEWSKGMFDAVVISGDESAVADGLRNFVDTSGADQLIAFVLPVGDAKETNERAMKLVATL